MNLNHLTICNINPKSFSTQSHIKYQLKLYDPFLNLNWFMILWSVGMSFIPSSNYFIRSELLGVFVSKINFMQKVKYLLSCLKLCAVQEINLQICVFSLQRGKSSTTRTGEPKILSSRDFSP